MLKRCSICEAPINENNNSKEHIIPNALGGRLKIYNFICKTCNNTTGHSWDAELIKQLNPLCLLLNIQREAGSTPHQKFNTTAGDEIRVYPNGALYRNPTYKKEKIGSKVNIKIETGTLQEAKQMLKGVKNKFPNTNIDELLNSAKIELSYLKDPIQFSILINAKAGRSIVKTILAFATQNDVNPFDCNIAREYLINGESGACFRYYYDDDLIENRPEKSILHCLSIRGDPNSRKILGYVEYFSTFRMIVLLSKEYVGDPFSYSYSINPITSENYNLNVNLSLSTEDVKNIFYFETISEINIQQILNHIMLNIREISIKREIDRLSSEVVKTEFKNCGAKKGEFLTKEHITKLIQSITTSESLHKFIMNCIEQKNLNRKNNCSTNFTFS